MSKKYIIENAYKQKKAIPAFNVSSLEALRAIFETAWELKYPVFIETSAWEVNHIWPELLSDMCKSLAKTNNVEYILHLDRWNDFELMEKCLKAWYDSISAEFWKAKDIFEVIELSKKARILTDKYDAILEWVMEVVPIVYYENKVKENHITDVDYARMFIQEVKPDLLCTAIWTQSWGKKNIWEIRYDVLERLQTSNPETPLMLHGWSFLDEEIVKKAISLWVTKININAELRYAYTNKLKQNLANKPEEYAPYRLLENVIEELKKVVEKKIKLFGNI